jgi:hypothetical protein
MKIETLTSASPLLGEGASAVESIESRLVRVSGEAPGVNRPDPAFDRLYQQLLDMEGQGEKAIYDFLKSLRGADGQTPSYPNAKALLLITHQVLVRLKDEGLEKSLLFKEVSGVNARAFNVDIFTSKFMQEVFQPLGDDAWEKGEW